MSGTFTLQYLFFNQFPWLFVVGWRHVVKNGVHILIKKHSFVYSYLFLVAQWSKDILYIAI